MRRGEVGRGGRGKGQERTHDGLLPGDFLRLGEAQVPQGGDGRGGEVCRGGPAVQRGVEAREERQEVREDAGGGLRGAGLAREGSKREESVREGKRERERERE